MHQTLLHVYTNGETNSEFVNNKISDNNAPNNAHFHSSLHNYSVLLSTALINLKSIRGNFIQCRALIDNASQNPLISKSSVERLNFTLGRTNQRLVGINGISAEACLNFTQCNFSPYLENNYNSLKDLVVNQVLVGNLQTCSLLILDFIFPHLLIYC